MVRAFWVPPLGCQRVARAVLMITRATPNASRFIASIIPTGPPPMMATGKTCGSDIGRALPSGHRLIIDLHQLLDLGSEEEAAPATVRLRLIHARRRRSRIVQRLCRVEQAPP